MQLHVICKKCFSSIKVQRLGVSSRGELKRKLNLTEFDKHCDKCGKTSTYHINRVWAKPNGIILLTGFFITILIGAYLLYFVFNHFWNKTFYFYQIAPLALVIPSLICTTFYTTENISVKSFNSHFI